MSDAVVELHADLPNELEAAGSARRQLRMWLGRYRDERVDDILIAASEIVTNAVIHARSLRSLDVRIDEERWTVRVAVTDESHDMPYLRALPSSDPGGMGLHLVAYISSSWGVEVHEHGKTVWFDAPLA